MEAVKGRPDDLITIRPQYWKVPGGLVKLKAVKGREDTKKRAATREKDVNIEQVDMAGPVFAEMILVGQRQHYQH